VFLLLYLSEPRFFQDLAPQIPQHELTHTPYVRQSGHHAWRLQELTRGSPPHSRLGGQRRAALRRAPEGGAAGGEARARPWRAGHALAAAVGARATSPVDGGPCWRCARTWLRRRVQALQSAAERRRAWGRTEVASAGEAASVLPDPSFSPSCSSRKSNVSIYIIMLVLVMAASAFLGPASHLAGRTGHAFLCAGLRVRRWSKAPPPKARWGGGAQYPPLAGRLPFSRA
jgi:hypothetical protein